MTLIPSQQAKLTFGAGHDLNKGAVNELSGFAEGIKAFVSTMAPQEKQAIESGLRTLLRTQHVGYVACGSKPACFIIIPRGNPSGNQLNVQKTFDFLERFQQYFSKELGQGNLRFVRHKDLWAPNTDVLVVVNKQSALEVLQQYPHVCRSELGGCTNPEIILNRLLTDRVWCAGLLQGNSLLSSMLLGFGLKNGQLWERLQTLSDPAAARAALDNYLKTGTIDNLNVLSHPTIPGAVVPREVAHAHIAPSPGFPTSQAELDYLNQYSTRKPPVLRRVLDRHGTPLHLEPAEVPPEPKTSEIDLPGFIHLRNDPQTKILLNRYCADRTVLEQIDALKEDAFTQRTLEHLLSA